MGFESLKEELLKHPKYVSGDDDLLTKNGILDTAELVLARMGEDLEALKEDLDTHLVESLLVPGMRVSPRRRRIQELLDEVSHLRRQTKFFPVLANALQTMVEVMHGPIGDLLTGDSMADTGAYDALFVAREALVKVAEVGAQAPSSTPIPGPEEDK